MIRFWQKVAFFVPVAAAVLTSTISAAPPPEPSVTLRAAPVDIYAGQSALLTWTSEHAVTISIEPGIGRVEPAGTLRVFPEQDTVYVISAASGKKTASASAAVTVTALPAGTLKADFSSDRQTGLTPLTVLFQDRSVAAADNTVVSWQWDFDGDGVIDSRSRNPSFQYLEPGRYTVSLTAGGVTGDSDMSVKTDYILADTDLDGDGVADSKDNCPALYNSTQVDLDGDGLGVACEDRIDLLHGAAHVVQIRKDSSADLNPADVTDLLKDGLTAAGVTIQKDRKFDVLTVYSAVEAAQLSMIRLAVFVSLAAGDPPKSVKIYAYEPDGISVQTSVFTTAVLGPGWNDLDLTALLGAMQNAGFVKFRLTTAQTGFTIAEAQLTGSPARGLDDRQIAASPSAVDFGSISAGRYIYREIQILNSGSGLLMINPIAKPAAPFVIVRDECSGINLAGADLPYGSKSCSLTIGVCIDEQGDYHESLTIVSNDMDRPAISVPLSVSVSAPAALTGVLTDAASGQPITDAPLVISLQRSLGDSNSAEFIYSAFDRQGAETIWQTADYSLIKENDEEKLNFDTAGERHAVAFRYPYARLDELQVAWNGMGGDSRERVLAQSFKAGAGGPLSKVALKLKKGASTGTFKGSVTVYLKSSFGGEKASILATSSQVKLDSLPDDQYVWVDVPFPSPHQLISASRYVLEIATPATVYDGYTLSSVIWAFAPAGAYRDGTGYNRVNGVWSETADSFEFRTFIAGELDQQPIKECSVCTGSMSQGLLDCGVSLSLGSRAGSTWAVLDSRNHEPGYDDLTLSGAVRNTARDLLVDDGWMRLSIYPQSYMQYPSAILATDQLVIKPFVSYSAVTDPEGAFSVPGLPVGEAEIIMSAPGYYPQAASCTLTVGNATVLAAALVKAPLVEVTIVEPVAGQIIPRNSFSVRGTLSAPAQVAVNGVQATIWGEAGTNFWANVALSEGPNTITATAVGAYGQVSSQSVTVIVLTTGTVKGIVRSYPGPVPAASALLVITDSQAAQQTTATDAAGAYEFPRVAAGTFSLSITKEGYNPKIVTGSVDVGQTKAVNIDLYPPPVISFSIDPETISSGQSATLAWSIQNCHGAALQPDFGSVACTGTVAASPSQTTTYTLAATGTGGSASTQRTLTVTVPAPTISFQTSTTELTAGQTARLTWSTTGAQTCFIEPGIGSVPVNGFVDVTPAATTTFTITASGPGGSAAARTTITVIPPPDISLEIIAPTDGSGLLRPDVMVSGTWSNPFDGQTGIIVNGVAALLYGDQFVANQVPLQSGDNLITATSTDRQGRTGNASITVTAEPEADHIRLTPAPEQGTLPLDVTLTIDGSLDISESHLSWSGPAAVEVLENGLEVVVVRLTEPGIYFFTAQAMAGDIVATATAAVLALDRQLLDAELKSIFAGLKTALASGDADSAAALFTVRDREKYRTVFNGLSGKLPQMASDMQEIELIYVRGDTAKYRTRRTQAVNGEMKDITYYIYFRIDADGVWRMVQF